MTAQYRMTLKSGKEYDCTWFGMSDQSLSFTLVGDSMDMILDVLNNSDALVFNTTNGYQVVAEGFLIMGFNRDAGNTNFTFTKSV